MNQIGGDEKDIPNEYIQKIVSHLTNDPESLTVAFHA